MQILFDTVALHRLNTGCFFLIGDLTGLCFGRHWSHVKGKRREREREREGEREREKERERERGTHGCFASVPHGDGLGCVSA